MNLVMHQQLHHAMLFHNYSRALNLHGDHINVSVHHCMLPNIVSYPQPIHSVTLYSWLCFSSLFFFFFFAGVGGGGWVPQDLMRILLPIKARSKSTWAYILQHHSLKCL